MSQQNAKAAKLADAIYKNIGQILSDNDGYVLFEGSDLSVSYSETGDVFLQIGYEDGEEPNNRELRWKIELRLVQDELVSDFVD